MPRSANAGAGCSGLIRLPQRLLVTLLVLLAMLAGWRIATGVLADRISTTNPQGALHWRPHHPLALMALARSELANGQLEMSTALARDLLAVEPLQGNAYGLIAANAAAAGSGDPANLLALHRVAVRRAPRDSRPRIWLINHYLQEARYAEALEQIDILLRIAPAYREQLYPALAQLAHQHIFANALAQVLHARPVWRAGFMEMLLSAGEPTVRSRVFGAIERSGGLQREEFDRWIETLILQQRWEEAYSRWAGNLALGNRPLRAVHNGDFGSPPSNSGFDWHILVVPGVQLDFTADAGTRGLAAHAHFPGRPVAKVNLEQPLLLAPGRYLLLARMRAESLEGESGLQWTVVCSNRSQLLGTSEPILGSFAWREIHTEFNVPSTGCTGQWLQLLNPAPAGAAQSVSGDLWLDDIAIRSLHNSAQAVDDVGTLRVDSGAAMRSEGADFVSVKSGARVAVGTRLMLTRDSEAVVTFDNGCIQNYKKAGVHSVDQHACAAAHLTSSVAGDAVPSSVYPAPAARSVSVPIIKPLQDIDEQRRRPIGR